MSQTQLNPQYSPLLATIVNQNNWATGIQALGRKYARPLALLDQLNPGGSTPMEGPEGKFLIAYSPRQEVVATVATVTQSGADLIITFTDSLYDGFREKIIVMDSNKNQGYVRSAAPGTITIQPATKPLVLSSSSHFLAGQSVNGTMGSAAGNHYSTGLKNLYTTNTYRTNYAAVKRETCTVSRREKFVTYKFDETFYSWSVNEMEMMDRFMKAKVYDVLFSEPGQFNTATEGVANRFEGLRAAVRNQGGRFISTSTVPTRADLIADLNFMAQADPAQEQNYLWIGGRAAWQNINDIFAGEITFTVSTATINGQTLNFDIKQATINGITVKFMTWGIFDDIVAFPYISTITGNYKESNTYAILNLSPVPNKLGGMIPSVRKFHYASSSVTGGAEILYRSIAGMVSAGPNSTGGGFINNYQAAASSVDGGQFEVLTDGGYDFTADASVWRELSA